MAELKKVWVLMYRTNDPSQETDPTVFLDRKKADADLAYAINGMVTSELDAIDWDKADADMLRSIMKAFEEKRYDDVISEWETWKDDHGPLDEDVDLVEADLVE